LTFLDPEHSCEVFEISPLLMSFNSMVQDLLAKHRSNWTRKAISRQHHFVWKGNYAQKI